TPAKLRSPFLSFKVSANTTTCLSFEGRGLTVTRSPLPMRCSVSALASRKVELVSCRGLNDAKPSIVTDRGIDVFTSQGTRPASRRQAGGNPVHHCLWHRRVLLQVQELRARMPGVPCRVVRPELPAVPHLSAHQSQHLRLS